jgi:hypothetical protein
LPTTGLPRNKKRAKKKGDDVARLVLFIAPGLATLQHKNTAFRFILALLPAQRSKQEFLCLFMRNFVACCSLFFVCLLLVLPVLAAPLVSFRQQKVDYRKTFVF